MAQLAHSIILTTLSAYTSQNTIISIALLTLIGVTLYSFNLGTRSINIVKRLIDTKILTIAYTLLVRGSFAITLTLIFATLYSFDSVTLTFNIKYCMGVTIVTFVNFLCVSSHYHHLTDGALSDEITETEMIK